MIKKLLAITSLLLISYGLRAQNDSFTKVQKEIADYTIQSQHSSDNQYFKWFQTVNELGDTLCTTLNVLDVNYNGVFDEGIDQLVLTRTPVRDGLFQTNEEIKFTAAYKGNSSSLTNLGVVVAKGDAAKKEVLPYLKIIRSTINNYDNKK